MNLGWGVTIQPTTDGNIVIKVLSKVLKRYSAGKILFTLAQTSFLCFPTGLLQNQSLQLQEQEKLLTKKGQQIYFHRF